MRAMYTGILKRSDYEKLMSMTRVGDVVRWLKESKGYGRPEGCERYVRSQKSP